MYFATELAGLFRKLVDDELSVFHRHARDKLEIEVAERTRQASLLNLTHDSIFVRDLSDLITYWNRGSQELYGWPPDRAVGRRSHDLLQTVFPAPLETINAELLRAGRWEGELTHTKADGDQVVVSSRWSLQRDEQGQPLAVLETNTADELEKALTRLRATGLRGLILDLRWCPGGSLAESRDAADLFLGDFNQA